ncbi:ribonuclease T2 family protein [Denitrobaculum tricleocarpae]|uniref:Ribonuclease n=1 Tax=Denitrobaculum tricleocarpae TaxID=2591009 RepID=A0A545U114_9PROT|nr:ribonuclease [Denitrobaculum tricleocarpae]TQV83155.1 ribonuclease [Denitrobaculum tricleocarpae]
MKRITLLASLTAALATFNDCAWASVKLEGWLIAKEACIASKSLRGSSGQELEPGRAYVLRGQNRADNPSHYQVRLGESGNSDRWVRIDCGVHVVRAGPGEPSNEDEIAAPATPLLLAVSWQPAFCEARPRQRECKSQHNDRFDASHFALHGLWPQPRENVYCDVSARMKRDDKDRRWDWLPLLDLEASTRNELKKVMPGTASFLHRHEWVKHGTCYSSDPETYYRDSLRMMAQLNSSEVQKLFVANVGQNVSAKAIRAAFETAFGPGSGTRVQVTCRDDGDRRLITELKIYLGGPLAEPISFADALQAGERTAPGCSGGIVDPVGQQ